MDLVLLTAHGLKKLFAATRDDAATKIKPAQIAEAQRMASEWKPK